jgi:hypothetical protein
LSKADAIDLVRLHLGGSARATHTLVVADLMRQLAARLHEDGELWEIVALCHDLDFHATAKDRSQHGLLVLTWLGDRVSLAARQAIASHDHRTGATSDTLLADMLKLADAVAVIDHRIGRDGWTRIASDDPWRTLREHLADRPYLAELVKRFADKYSLDFASVVALVTRAPLQ